MSDIQRKYFCPRLLDYIVIVGAKNPNRNNSVAQTPELLRRYPLEDHDDFHLPPDVVFFCQPEGCINVGPKRMSLRESTSFVFTLTEKDSGRVRYGICVNFYRPFEKEKKSFLERTKLERTHSTYSSSSGERSSVSSLSIPSQDSEDRPKSPRTRRKLKIAGRLRNHTLTSLCIISHHPFFSTIRECLFTLRKLIDACNERSCSRRIGASKTLARDGVWGVLTGHCTDSTPSLVMHEVREIETWILRMLSAPVPVPGKTKVEIQILPADLHPPVAFALPDHTRFPLVDFPLHLPLELLGVDTCLKVLTFIILEHKLVLQSRDYNALSMSVMAFVSMLYPLEYMFPVIPLLPTCMNAAEQLLLAPTPFIIGIPATFLMYKKGFQLPDDVWLVDLDSSKITVPKNVEEIPVLPEPEGTVLKNHLKQCLASELSACQALASMSMSPQPIKNLDTVAHNPEMWKRRESFSNPATGFNPLIYGNDVDSVDVATRVAMIRFFNSPNTLGNFLEHTRTLRLYPRPVVAFQFNSFIKSRPLRCPFTAKLARTQAVEYYAEWALSPTNVVFLRVQTGVYDPLLIGDKPKWYSQGLQKINFKVYDDESSTLGLALQTCSDARNSDENPTDESGSDSDGAESTSSSYSSLSDFVLDIQNSDINGETPEVYTEDQVLTVDESQIFKPPSQLQVPETPISNSDSAMSAPDSDLDDSSSSDYEKEEKHIVIEDKPAVTQQTTVPPCTPPQQGLRQNSPQPSPPPVPIPSYKNKKPPPLQKCDGDVFKYDSGRVTPTTKFSRSEDQPDKPKEKPPRPPPPYSPSIQTSTDSAFESLHRANSTASTLTMAGRTLSRTASECAPKSVPPMQRQRTEGQPKTPPWKQAAASFKAFQTSREDKSDTGSIISTISSELNGYAQTASNTISELLGLRPRLSSKLKAGNNNKTQTTPTPRQTKPFAPLGNRKALVEKSGLVKHATSKKEKTNRPANSHENKANTNSENQQFLKDIVQSVLDGQGIGWLKVSRVRKLMEDENYRNFVVSRVNTNLDKRLNEDDLCIEDVCITKPVFKGMLTLMKALIGGLEHTYQNKGVGGSASAFMVLEILHTHYWIKEGSNKSDSSNPSLQNSPFGSRESLASAVTESAKTDTRGQQEEMVPAVGSGYSPGWRISAGQDRLLSPQIDSQASSTGSPVVFNGEEFENIELRAPDNQVPTNGNCNPVQSPGMSDRDIDNNEIQREASKNHANTPGASTTGIVITEAGQANFESGDMLRELVKNKELMRTRKRDALGKYSSIESEMSEASTLVSTSSDNIDGEHRRRSRINHQSIRSVMSDSEMEPHHGPGRKKRSPSVLSSKSSISSGYRYYDGKMVTLAPNPDNNRTYLFEPLVGKDRSWLWDQMQFWEDAFLDAVAQERDIIGMDQGPAEMIDRYVSLGDTEKKRLEHDEDRLLSVMLYNTVSFMTMQRVSKNEVRRKVRRLLGKSHIGLLYSQDINRLLDQIGQLHGNDIDLKPMGSRMMQKQSFTVHWGTDNKGDMLFMEVCDDCLILRSVTGAICDRWWYEKLVNMTYCPKTKVLCLWRKHGGKTQLNKFYTKKCKELYFTVKDSMEKAATRNHGKPTGPELGGEFPVQDLRSGQGGLLQVCMEGIGLLFDASKEVEMPKLGK